MSSSTEMIKAAILVVHNSLAKLVKELSVFGDLVERTLCLVIDK